MTRPRRSKMTRPARSRRYVLDEQAGFLLRVAMQRHTAIFMSRMIEDLTQTQFAALAKLHAVRPCSQNQLGRLVVRDASLRDAPHHEAGIGCHPPTFRKISRSRAGVTGNCVIAPGIPMASSIALAIAAPAALMPPSPAPLRPSGLSGLGASSVITTSNGGTSRAVGIR